MPTPDTAALWADTLDQLQRQMTRHTFDTHLRDARLLSAANDVWHIAVRSDSSREWLQSRLYDTIRRTAASVTGRELQLQFVVAPASDQAPPPPAVQTPVRAVDLWQPPEPNQGRPSTRQSKRSPSTSGSLAIDIRSLNQTGYQPLTNYYPQFIAPYLRQRWGSAGDRAFVLWTQLVADDGQQLTAPSFTNWTRPRVYQLETLAEQLGSTVPALTGRYGYCPQFNLHRNLGAPLARCCRPDDPDTEFQADRYCRHWRPGALEVLSAEGVLRVTERGGRKNYRLTVQLWRSWPLLTPFQVSRLAPRLRQNHLDWLAKWQAVTGLPPARWAEEQAESVVDQFPDRETGLVCRQPFVRNPFFSKK